MIKSYCFGWMLLYIFLIIPYDISAQIIDGNYTRIDYPYLRINVKNDTLRYYFDTFKNSGDVLLAECSVSRIDEDVIEIDSFITGYDALENTSITYSQNNCSEDNIEITISLPNLHYTSGLACVSYSQSVTGTPKNAEVIVSKGMGTILLYPGSDRAIYIHEIAFIPDVANYDLTYHETAPSILRAYIVRRDDADLLRLESGKVVSISSEALSDSVFDMYCYHGDYLLDIGGSLRWRGQTYKKIEDD